MNILDQWWLEEALPSIGECCVGPITPMPGLIRGDCQWLVVSNIQLGLSIVKGEKICQRFRAGLYAAVHSVGPYKLHGGLVQPNANWAKHTGPISEGKGSGRDTGGKMFCRLPGQGGVITPGYWVRGHLLEHHAAALPGLYILILPTDRVLYQTSRVFSSPPPPPGSNPCALIATKGHIGGNHLPEQGKRPPHQRLRQWNCAIKGPEAIRCRLLSYLWYLSFFYTSLQTVPSYFLIPFLGFWKIGVSLPF